MGGRGLNIQYGREGREVTSVWEGGGVIFRGCHHNFGFLEK